MKPAEDQSAGLSGQASQQVRWFNLGDLMWLERKLQSCPNVDAFLDDQNDHLSRHSKGTITLREVAFVACVYEKNIRQNIDDPGAVPHDAAEKFSCRCDLSKRRLENMHVRAAINVLEAVGFMTHTRCADKARGLCAAYKLLNEEFWKRPSLPTLNGNPNANTNEDV